MSYRKGISQSALPYKRTPPSWLKITPSEVVEQVCKLAKKGLTPSQIGVILRDSHGIGQVKYVTGNKILRILRAHGEFLSLYQKNKTFCSLMMFFEEDCD
jgi:small subunit ribosomal protein S13e